MIQKKMTDENYFKIMEFGRDNIFWSNMKH